jgi:hypothetical protein
MFPRDTPARPAQKLDSLEFGSGQMSKSELRELRPIRADIPGNPEGAEFDRDPGGGGGGHPVFHAFTMPRSV